MDKKIEKKPELIINEIKKSIVMTLDELNSINKQISELITIIEKYDHVDMIAARKALKDSGKKISEYYYRYDQKVEEINEETSL